MTLWTALSQAMSSVGHATNDLFAFIGLASHSNPRSREAAFSMAAVALSAKLARADGVVTQAEVESFWRHFDIPPEGQEPVRKLFALAQQDVAGFQSYAQRIARLFPDDDAVREDLLDVLFGIAAADKVIHLAELTFLGKVAEIFEIDAVQFERIKARHLEPEGNPHAVLGTSADMPFAEIRRRYLKLVSEHHPDSLAARGVPAEFVRLSSDRLAAINAAYEAIARHQQPGERAAPESEGA